MYNNKSSSQQKLRAAGAVLALLAAATLPLSATAQNTTPAADDSAAALTVVRDADTGQLRAPTADEAAALTRKSNARALRSAPPPALQKFHVSGARGARLTDEMANAAVMVRTPDGKLAAQCVDSHEAAEGIHQAGHIHTTSAPTE